MNEIEQELSEKSKELEYVRLNFSNKLEGLKFEKNRLIKKINLKNDANRIDQLNKEINENYE